METVKINASKSYAVIIGSGLLDNSGEYISRVIHGKTAMVVSDDIVFSLYGERLVQSLKSSGFETHTFVFPHGEQSKNLSTYGELLNTMCRMHISGNDVVVALGGGVTGDMAGFAAATYRRGIDFVQIPTTLLAAVDSSVGGKTAVDLDNGKNQVGAFHQPSLVLCDTDTLNTLPELEYRNGCAEIIKYGMLGSIDLLNSISETPVCEQYEKVISTCVSMKRDFVEQDERDKGCRMLLNFGHTVGHTIETCSSYTVPHGMAVASGMAIVTRAAVSFDLCDRSIYNILIEVLEKYSLPTETDFSAQNMADASIADKKRQGDKLTLIVPEAAGKCVMKEIHKDSIIDWLKAGGVK